MKSDKAATPPPHDTEEAPPPFSVYKAQVKRTGSFNGTEDIASHDAHINSDGEALNQFILEQLPANVPRLRFYVLGTEYANRTGTYQVHTDFEFFVDIPVPPQLVNQGIQWSLADSEPAFRGRSSREISKNGIHESVSSSVAKDYISQRDARRRLGLPPWVMDLPLDALPILQDGADVGEYIDKLRSLEQNAWKSSRSLREWADHYCTTDKTLKEFAFQQETYGYNVEKLKTLIKNKILEAGYRGEVRVEWWHRRGRIYVRPASTLSKLLSKLWHGGGVWKVCGVAYPLVGWVDANPDEEGAIKTSSGFKKRLGATEEEWIEAWRDTIINAVNLGAQHGSAPFVCPNV